VAGGPTETRPLAGRTILAVFAHPDDESLACGGTLARASDAGARVVLVCGSRGERGSISDPALVAGRDLAAARTRELLDAARVLGIAEVIALDHPDGDLRWADVPAFHGDIVRAVADHRPDAVITFDEDGLYWHLDHIGVHERTLTAVRSFGVDAPPLYFVTLAKGNMRGIIAAAQAKRGAPSDASFWGITPDAFGDAARPPTLVVDVRAWAARKLRALRCHQTQMGPRNPLAWIDEDEAREWLGVERFRRAPIDGRVSGVLESLADAVNAATGDAR
jgi:LmbE family N-acetylglucosaminyl deacetylase